MPLLQRHWREIALFQDKVPLDPNFEAYYDYERNNQLAVLVARSKGMMVGYDAYIVGPMLHYRSTLGAKNDIFWLDPAFRGGWDGVRMFKEAERGLKRLGVKVVFHGPKLHFENGRVVELLKRLGHVPIETVTAKWIGD